MRRLAPALVATVVLAACGGTASDERAAGALQQRLERKSLSVSSIHCLDSGIRFRDAASWLCTVDFGDPHLVPYCVVLVDGRAVTDRELPELRCYPPEEESRYRENAHLPATPASAG